MLVDPVNPLFAIVTSLYAVGIGVVLADKFPGKQEDNRVSTLDGLRGILVIAVFIGHASVWYFYLKTGLWKLPPSNFYGNLGQASVALFFMITSFLFYSKLLRAEGQKIDWTRLYISRALRLTPLYIFMLVVLLIIVAFHSKFVLVDSPKELIRNVLRWVPFGLWGMPDINGVSPTANIVASVLWTLPYEWLFYFSLPALALFARVKINRTALFTTLVICSIVIWKMRYPGVTHLFVFLGGILAAYCQKSNQVRNFCRGKTASTMALASLTIVLFGFPTSFETWPIFLLSIFFTIVACGNTFFGILVNRGVRVIGDVGYSIYLLHGIILYLGFSSSFFSSSRLQENPLIFWGIVNLLTAPLICSCFLTFRYIETPAMNNVAQVHSMVSALRHGFLQLGVKLISGRNT